MTAQVLTMTPDRTTHDPARRAVITGLGVAAASGLGADAHWKAVLDRECRIGRITLFDPGPYSTTLAGEVPEFDVADHVESRLAVQTDRWTHLGLAAVAQALDSGGLDPSRQDPYSMAVVMASSSGGNLFGQRELQRLWSQPDRTVGAYQSIAWFYAASVGQISILHGMKGPSTVLASEAAGGLDSLGHAARLIRRGTATVLAGGTECPLSPYALTCQQQSGWLSSGRDPRTAYAPFDLDAAGYVPAEGGAVLLVEELESARRRGAPEVLAEIVGWASTHDGEPTRRGGAGSVRQYARAIRTACERAAVQPADVDLVFLDALGVPGYDVAEAEALRAVFGSAAVPAVTTQKPLIGRSHQGGAVIDVVTAVRAMAEGVLPPAVVPRRLAPGCELPFVTEPRSADVRVVVVLARGFDGFNTALVLRRFDDDRHTDAAERAS